MSLSTRSHRRGWSPWVEHVLDGYTLRVYRWSNASSQAAALLMIHGLEEGWSIWTDLCQRLTDRFHALSLDLPWNGEGGYRWSHIRSPSDWLHQAFELTATPPAALIAHSFGVNVLLEYLQRCELPSLRALILVSPFYSSRYEEFDWAFFDHIKKTFREAMRYGLKVRRGKRRVNPSLLSDMTDRVLDRVGPLGFIEFFSLFSRTPALQLDRIRVPVLVVGGADDFISKPAGATALAQALPDGRCELLDGCGHFCMLEQPIAFERTVRRFLTEQLSR